MVHCFFEQSGTFKNEFIKLGYDSKDYDLCNEFGQTDIICDLFKEIDNAWHLNNSILSYIEKNDLIFAFFPCIRFSEAAQLLSRCDNYSLRDYNDHDKIMYTLYINQQISRYYEILCWLVDYCIKHNIKLIIENPYKQPHYLTQYFPFKPDIIDKDRRNDGDYFQKPTQYWFFNFKPYNNILFEPITYLKEQKVICQHGINRSLISPEYANRFIRKYVINGG